MKPGPQMRERAAGCLVGAAVGDAFGMPLEFHGPPRVQVRELTDGRLSAGNFTDDSEMMLALAESLLAHKPPDMADLARRFLDWFRRGPADVGIHTTSVLSRLAGGDAWDEASLVVQFDNPQAAGNGSLMRCFPVALLYWDDAAGCDEVSRLQSRVTHAHPETGAACAFVNAAIRHALAGAGAQEAINGALADVTAMPAELRAAILAAPGKSAGELDNSGWVRHSVESAVWGLLTSDNYAEAVIRVANLGRDADTAAAIVGALAGAVYGLNAIPLAWREQLHGEWPLGDGIIWGADEFTYLANALLDGRQLDLRGIPTEVHRPSPPAEDRPRREQYRGALLGGALGDALGLPFEATPGNARRGQIGRISGFEHHGARRGRISDDTQLTIVVAECLLANGRLDPEDMGRRLVEWLQYAVGAGRTTRGAVERIRAGAPWYAAADFAQSGGNGSAMRSAPVGLLNWRDAASLRLDAVLSSLPTHSQPVAVAGAVAMAAATAFVLVNPAGSWTPTDFIAAVQAACEGLESEAVPERHRPSVSATLYDRLGELPDKLRLAPERYFERNYSGGFVLESLPAAFYCFLRSPDDPLETILTAVNYSHDTDSVAAMAGTLGGALMGVEALPEWLLDAVEQRDVLIDLADNLFARQQREDY